MMSQNISFSMDATAPALNPRKRSFTPLPFFFHCLLFFPRCGYAAIRCIDTALEEGLLQLRGIYQGCTTQGALQVMLPLLHEHDVRRLTLETGIVAKNKKPFQLTVGSSFRHAFSTEGFWGVNGVLDASGKESGTQLSVGIEGYLSSFFTSLSYYLPLGTIQEASVQTEHKKQLAKSIEARVFYTFSSVNSIRTGIVVEQLMGNAIELPGTEEKQKNPRRGSLQIEYQPMSFVTFHLGYQFQSGSSRRHQVVTGIGLTFRFNQPLSEQTKRLIQKKVLLTGDGAYEMISRRHDRAIDHETMPKTATPVVVLATTQGAGKTTAQRPVVTVPEPSGGTNGGGSAPQDQGKITSSLETMTKAPNGNSVNEGFKKSQVYPVHSNVKYEPPRFANIDQQKSVSPHEQLRDATKGAFTTKLNVEVLSGRSLPEDLDTFSDSYSVVRRKIDVNDYETHQRNMKENQTFWGD